MLPCLGVDYQDANVGLSRERAGIVHSAVARLQGYQLLKYERSSGRF